jgi:threonine/homoserine/homoserine lactone efflux protein
MTFLDTFSYYLTLVTIAVAPGPMLLLLMTRAASNDVKGAIGFALGAAFGSLTIITVVCLGLSVWLTEIPEVLTYSKYLMLAYILWIAKDMWQGGFDMNGTVKTARSGFGLAVAAGFATCILSPYMLVLFPLVLPEVMDITAVVMPDFLIITFTTFLAEATAAALIVGLASQLRRLTRTARSAMIMNRSLASVLMIGGGWLALA